MDYFIEIIILSSANIYKVISIFSQHSQSQFTTSNVMTFKPFHINCLTYKKRNILRFQDKCSDNSVTRQKVFKSYKNSFVKGKTSQGPKEVEHLDI